MIREKINGFEVSNPRPGKATIGSKNLTIFLEGRNLTIAASTGKPITFASLEVYRKDNALPDRFDPHTVQQVVEVGPGLSEFLPWLVETRGGEPNLKPIAIDPVDYQLVVRGLQTLVQLNITEVARETILEFIHRAEVINDPTKVTLINTNLEEALKHLPVLTGIADVVVEHLAIRDFYVPYNPEQLAMLEMLRKKPLLEASAFPPQNF